MKKLQQLAATAALGLASVFAQAAPIVVDVSGAQSINLLGEAGNTVWVVQLGANAALNSLDWTLNLDAFAPSLLSEMQLSFGNSSGAELFTFVPGNADAVSGSGSYTGSLDLSALGLAVGADGELRIEFSESFKDFADGVAEGEWASGNLTFDVSPFAVPEPSSALLLLLALGVAGLQTHRSSRRRTADKELARPS